MNKDQSEEIKFATKQLKVQHNRIQFLKQNGFEWVAHELSYIHPTTKLKILYLTIDNCDEDQWEVIIKTIKNA